jgi:MoxR-like ATPase
MSNSNSKLILPKIKQALEGFVFAEEIGEVVSLGLTLNKPVLLHGPGGHGKSEIVRKIFEALAENSDEWGIQSFGEGMTEDKIYGGLDLDALSRHENKAMQFFPERSFLNKKYYLFEEFADAPPVVLLSLKDTLTALQLNNGHQTYEMKTLLLIAATNANPAEIREKGATYDALMDRFPLQAAVVWKAYNREAFFELFNKVEKSDAVVSSSMKGLLAQLISDAYNKGHRISPRTAIVCMNLLKASATLHGRTEVNEDDFFSIKFVPGTEQILEDLTSNLERIRKVARAQELLTACEDEVNEVLSKMRQYEQNHKLTNKPAMFLRLSCSLENIENKLQNLSLPDNLVRQRNELCEKVRQANLDTVRLGKKFSA